MTIAIHNECLYVILDFEGIGSFERTDQDDMLLALFNSALSTFTIFKTEQRVDKDTSQIFSNFNLGCSQLQECEQIFRGIFCIVIRDIAPTDSTDVKREFLDKINIFSYADKHENFIEKHYREGVQIIPFSPFHTENFYENINYLRVKVMSTKPVFFGGSQFLDTMKMLMAKFASGDFLSLSSQLLDERLEYLKSRIPLAIRYGKLPHQNNSSLKLLDSQGYEIGSTWLFSSPELQMEEKEVDGLNFALTEESLIWIVSAFSQLVSPNSKNVSQWRKGLELFLAGVLENRFKQAKFWLNEKVKDWHNQNKPEYKDALYCLMNFFNTETRKVKNEMTLCDQKCEECFLKCTDLLGHNTAHSCSTTHFCPGNCDFCTDTVQMCSLMFGHANQHLCKDFDHTCKEPCSFQVKNGCPNKCILLFSHDGDHLCEVKTHKCNEKCSLHNCGNTCQIDYSIDHQLHVCSEKRCIGKCCIAGCSNRCISKDHFHGNNMLQGYRNFQDSEEIEAPFLLTDGSAFSSDDHFCGEEHLCPNNCEKEGYCKVSSTNQLGDERLFEGQRESFTYKRIAAQTGWKQRCLIRIPPFEKNHQDEHSCSLSAEKVHTCTEICPTCENICNKPHGHESLHHTIHGNMKNCYFICNQEDFDVGAHKYKVGEKAVAEFCHVFCQSLGRGHIHVIECPGDDCLNLSTVRGSCRRHATCIYGPNAYEPKDEIWHCNYWKSIGFEDPCSAEQRETFNKCPFYCATPVHRERQDEKQYCMLNLWHDPVRRLSDIGFTYGTVSIDGHVFPCQHPKKAVHWVLTLDKSGSMQGDPWRALIDSTTSFMNSRRILATSDKYSIILYDHASYLIQQFQDVATFDSTVLSRYIAGGKTNFSAAIAMSDRVIGDYLDARTIPILVFMSDGNCNNGENEMAELARKYTVNHKLEVYTIGFGNANFEKLKQLARVGKGRYIECPEEIDLEHTFVQIASETPAMVSVKSYR